MTPRRKPPKKDTGNGDDFNDILIPGPPFNTEKMMADLTRLLEEQEFESIEEANEFLEELVASGKPIPSREPETPLEQAQELIYTVMDSGNRRKRVKLAKQALEISEDCADAYLILAEESRSPEEALAFLEQGIAAGERAIGAEGFAEYEGSFWGVLSTRPYMRVRLALALALFSLGEVDEAIEHFKELLRLNPNDNQGVRYLLLLGLLSKESFDEAEALLREYVEPTAICTYTNALLSFRRYGPTRKTEKSLVEAIELNPHVPAYLLGEERLPRRMSDYVGFGDESEAVSYAAEFMHFWLRQEGALDWLRDVEAKQR